jgi:RNA polymerase sigma-70 factor (ECF subfamily)
VRQESVISVRDLLAQALDRDGDRLYGLALRVTGDRDLAADVVQDAFRAALEHAGEFRGESAVTTWLYRIVFNRAVDLLRRRRRDDQLPDDPDELARTLPITQSNIAPLPDDLLERQETRAVVDRALEELGPRQRAVFELHEVEGRSTAEVAEVLGLTPGAVRVSLHRARLTLRAKLAALVPTERPS